MRKLQLELHGSLGRGGVRGGAYSSLKISTHSGLQQDFIEKDISINVHKQTALRIISVNQQEVKSSLPLCVLSLRSLSLDPQTSYTLINIREG